MKKIISGVLIVALLLSVSAFAFALEDDDVGNVTNFGSYSGDITLTSSSNANVEIIFSGNDNSLNEEQKKLFAEGHKKMVDVNPGLGEIQYYVYVKCDKFPVELQFTLTNTSKVKAAIWKGEKYADLDVKKIDDHTVSISVPYEGALYLYEASGGAAPGKAPDKKATPVTSVVGPKERDDKTSHKPPVECDIRITPLIDEKKLTQSQIDIFNEGYKDLKNVVPSDALVQYYVYVESDKYPVDADFRISNINSMSAKFYTGTWQELKVVDNKDGTVTITIPCEGALAIFNNKTEQMKLTAFEDKDTLNDTAKALFEAADADLKDICPKGMENKVFAYCESRSFPVSYNFELGEFTEFTVMFSINGKWVELDGNDNKDGTVRISVPCEGCLAIFTK